ncbi:MAG: rhomboid family intramembrane serine protease [Planctomycetota bacterium]
MFPIKDNIPTRERPVINIALIVVTVLAFLAQLGTPEGAPSLVERYGMIPARVTSPDAVVEIPEYALVRYPDGRVGRELVSKPAAPASVPTWLTLLTCVFLHGGWLHLLGNMWFLWIFGDNVEDCFGKLGYLAFYLLGGVFASVTHLVTNLGSSIPTIGASGAVAAVMGAYFVLYPRAKVLAIVPIFFFIQMLVLPASWFLGVWFLLQLMQGSFSMGTVASAGVAWWAHIGGFAMGYVAARVLEKRHRLKPRVEVLAPDTERTGSYRFRARPPREW